jgi:annexin A7/11
MSETLDQLEAAVKDKNEEIIISITQNFTNEERVKLREDYKVNFGRDLLEDFSNNFKDEFLKTIIGVFQSPIEYDVELLHKSLDKFISDKHIITEVICFRSQRRLKLIRAKYQEKYGKDLIEDIKNKTSGDYQKIILNLLEDNRSKNKEPDLENCSKIADELYTAGEGKIGTDEDVFTNYFTTLSKEELLEVCKSYHRKHAKTMLDVLHNEFSGKEKKLLDNILYSLFAPSEYFARQINKAIKGFSTDNDKLIRCIITRYSIDMKRVKKYYKRIYQKELLDDVKNDVKGSYERILETLINKHD